MFLELVVRGVMRGIRGMKEGRGELWSEKGKGRGVIWRKKLMKKM
jgi:hypothetical protein